MTRSLVPGAGFQHVIYESTANPDNGRWHLYIEGDGQPGRYGDQASADPTPRRPVALQLMALDSASSIYLGRPCYFGQHQSPACQSEFWTSARFGSEVVDSLAEAATQLLTERSAAEVVLIGYSGGGALATLLADRIPNVQLVLTLAANLDTEAWARQGNFLPLDASQNPIHTAQLSGIAHRHYAGGSDDNVPVGIIAEFARMHQGELRVMAGFNHHCCWQAAWPAILQDATALLENSP